MKKKSIFYRNKPAFVFAFLFFGTMILQLKAQGPCPNKITALNGVQHFDCTDVTITPNGHVESNFTCTAGSGYWISSIDESSITFSFSTPASAVVLDIDAFTSLEFDGNGYEEVRIEINGAPYPFPDAGLPGCKPFQAILTPGGGLKAPDCNMPLCLAGSREITIYETIYEITVKDIIVANSNLFGGVAFSIFFCCYECSADAGILNAPARSLCPDALATVPQANNTMLAPDDILQYVLYSNPADSVGSIVATSNTPSFAFDPAIMQTGVQYYLAAIAGENQNGNVNLSDPCLDFSNAIEVIWWPWPTVAFSIPNPEICPGDCVSVDVNFTGEPPFLLTYQSSFGGQVTLSFQEFVDAILLCAPQNTQPGAAMVKATQLIDKHCSCN